MAKTPPPPPPTDAQVAQAAQSAFMRDLLQVARAFGAAGISSSLKVTLPQLVQGWVTEKNGYRKIPVNAGAEFIVDKITMGKRAGLLFCFKPAGAPVADKDNPAWIEMEWNDVINAFGDLADDVDQRFAAAQELDPADPVIKVVADVNDRLKKTIAANAGMHGILKAGFERAYNTASETAHQAYEEALPGFGEF